MLYWHILPSQLSSGGAAARGVTIETRPIRINHCITDVVWLQYGGVCITKNWINFIVARNKAYSMGDVTLTVQFSYAVNGCDCVEWPCDGLATCPSPAFALQYLWPWTGVSRFRSWVIGNSQFFFMLDMTLEPLKGQKDVIPLLVIKVCGGIILCRRVPACQERLGYSNKGDSKRYWKASGKKR